jgi:thiamine biosynthesis lipoprotein
MALVSRASQPPPVPVAAGAGGGPLRRLRWTALGTSCEIQYDATADEARAQAFERAATGWVEAFEARYSRFRPDSLVSRINAGAGVAWVEVDAEMEQMLELCARLHFTTQGILDATALPLMRLWDYRAAQPRLPAEAEIAAARERVGWSRVQRAPGRVFLPVAGMALDFGGFGKEYAVDIVAQIARDHGIQAALVDFGHDLRAVGLPPGRPAWHIGLEDPQQPGAHRGSIALTKGEGVASSGDYQRAVVIDGCRYGHIIDPRSGRPVANGCRQATVVAPSCLLAGVLSTTAFVLGVPAGIQFVQSFPGAEALLVSDSARAQTRGFFHYVVF